MPVTPITNVDFFMRIGESIIDAAAQALECYGLEVPDRKFVGFDRPPQDCCPELVAWLGTVRTWDGEFPDTRRYGDLKYVWGYAFDCTIRISRCYIDSGENGEPMDPLVLQDWAKELYSDATALYVGLINEWAAGNISELTKCDLVNVGTMTQYNGGGCAGHEFTITVGTFL